MVVSYGFAQTWTQTSPDSTSSWTGIACSADGKVVIAINSTAKPLLSIDSGNTWTTIATAPDGYSCVASSADGTKLLGSFFGGGIYPYVSADSGMTWAQTSASNADWRAVACSADGSNLLAAGYNTSVWLSTNSGASWQTSSAPIKQWTSLASSADGTKLIGAGSGQIYISTNSGNNWRPAAAGGYSVATSANGSVLVATEFTGYYFGIPQGGTYISTNSGISWRTNPIVGSFVASSADGKRLIISIYASEYYASTDSGVTWVTNSTPFSSYAFALSADGCRLFATSFSQGIWVGQVDPSPQLNLAAADTSLALSWLVPSTDFVLQQNLYLTTTNWVTLTNAPTLNFTNLNNELTLPPSNSSGFFRLITQ